MSSLPASIKRIWSKTTEKRWRHRFPHYKSMGAFCFHGNQSFDPICPKTLCNLSPTLMMLHIKFDQHWLTVFRDIQVSSELWQNHRILEGQGKSSIDPTFSKRGCNKSISQKILLESELSVTQNMDIGIAYSCLKQGIFIMKRFDVMRICIQHCECSWPRISPFWPIFVWG